MRYRQLGTSGLTVSVTGLGGNNFGKRIDLDRTAKVVHTALDEGITLIDTADVYGQSEDLLGQVLGSRRREVVLATKFGSFMGGAIAGAHEARGSRRYIQLAVESSLGRLRTEWIDLLQMHEPDPNTPIEETLLALSDLVQAGKVRYIGLSNVVAWQLAEAHYVALLNSTQHFISVQNEYSLLNREVEEEIVPLAVRYGVGLLPFFPLANGLLTGKYQRGVPPTAGRLAEPAKQSLLSDQAFDTVERLEEFARERGLSMIEVAIGGLAAKPAVGSVIAGATSPDQVRANAAAIDWEPSGDDLAALDAATAPPQADS